MSQPSVPIPRSEPIGYATAELRGPRVWAGAALLAFSLGLIVVGGCFLIGVLFCIHPMIMNGPNAAGSVPLRPGEYVFVGFLIALSIGCFCCAAMVGVRGLRGLFQILG